MEARRGGCRSAKRAASFRDGRGEIIIMQMPCCGEEESEQQMSGTAPPGKNISDTVLFVLFRAPVIEYKVGSEMKHGPGMSCISSHGFQHRTEEVTEFFHSLAADRCHRLRIATDRRHTCVSFYEIRRKRRQELFLVKFPFPPPNRNPYLKTTDIKHLFQAF